MVILRTGRLVLREMSHRDVDAMAGLLGDPEVTRYYPRPYTRAEAQGWIDWNLGLYATHGFGLWVVELAATGEFMGDCGLTVQQVDGVDEIEVGYHLLPRFHGLGHATEAATAVRDLARERFSARRLIAIVNPVNVPSRRVAERLGFTVEKYAYVHGRRCVIYAG